MQILAISGSLRATSTNTALLQAAASASRGAKIILYNGLAELPPFNPDLDNDDTPKTVIDLRVQVQTCDGLLISTPEYAHGVPGTLKNALDWLVGSSEIVGKPVALFNASSRGVYAQASLTEILKTMSAHVIEDAAFTVSLLGKTPAEIAANVATPEFSAGVRSALDRFIQAIDASR